MGTHDWQREILLVEDNPDDAELAMLALRESKLSNRIHWVRDGVEALEYLYGPEDAPHEEIVLPTVMLLDLKLPRLDGIAVARRVKSDPRTAALPVIVMTSSREDRDVIESYRLGVNSYVVKPVDFAQFTEAVRQLGLYWLLLNQPPLGGKSPERGADPSM